MEGKTGHTKHCYTMLIPRVYNVCGYTVTAEGTHVQMGRLGIEDASDSLQEVT